MSGSFWVQVIVGILLVGGGAWMFYENVKGTRYTWTVLWVIPIPFSFWGPIAMVVLGGLIAVGRVSLPA
jgi:hypothetical protein